MQKFSEIYTALVLAVILATSVAVFPLGLVQGRALGSLQYAEYSGIEVIDWRNKKIVLPEVPEKIISLGVPFTVILYALGAGDKVAGVDKSSIDYAKEGLSTFLGVPGKFERYEKLCSEVPNKPNLGSSWYPSMEPILNIAPDVVFMYYFPGTLANIEALEGKGILVIGVAAETFDDVYRLMELIGKVVGASGEADVLIGEINSRLNRTSEKVENLTKPKVYVESTSHYKTTGSGTFTNSMIEIAGGENIFKDLAGFQPVTSEVVIERNPEVIIFQHTHPLGKRALKEGRSAVDILLEERPAWKDIKAVKDRRVHILLGHYWTYDQRLVIGVELMAKWFHPEVFGIEKSIEKLISTGPGESKSISTEGVSVTQVTITTAPGKCIREAMLSIKQISQDASLTPWNMSTLERQGFTVHIYKYLEIKLEPWTPENVSEVKLSFNVENSWLRTNGLSMVDVALFRWNETTKSWDEIKVNLPYEAASPRLSMFAIAGMKPLPPPIWAQPWLWGIMGVIVILTLIAVLQLRMLKRPKPT